VLRCNLAVLTTTLAPLPQGVLGEGPDCNFLKEIGGLESSPDPGVNLFLIFILALTRLCYLTVQKFRIVVETRRSRPMIIRNPCVPVCGYRAGYFGLGLAHLEAQIQLVVEDFRPDPKKFSGPFQVSRVKRG
jgi:hypothetical protein